MEAHSIAQIFRRAVLTQWSPFMQETCSLELHFNLLHLIRFPVVASSRAYSEAVLQICVGRCAVPAAVLLHCRTVASIGEDTESKESHPIHIDQKVCRCLEMALCLSTFLSYSESMHPVSFVACRGVGSCVAWRKSLNTTRRDI